MKKILAIIPALNEAGSIVSVIEAVRSHAPQVGVLVVNDGSSDDTARLARRAGAVVLDMPFNVGIGAAMQAGYLYADQMGYEAAIQIDGDGQHPPRHIGELLEALDNGTDMVIGSRFVTETGYLPSISRRVGIRLLSRLISLILSEKITDTTSGYRAVNRRVIELFSRHYPHDYPEPEVVVLLHKAGFKMKEVPVSMNYRETGTTSINLFQGLYYVAKVMLAIFVDLFKNPPTVPGSDYSPGSDRSNP